MEYDLRRHNIDVAKYSLMYHAIEYNSSNGIYSSLKHGELEQQREGDIVIIHVASIFFTNAASIKSIQRVQII